MAQPNRRSRIDLAFDALEVGDWNASARLAEEALAEADLASDPGAAALARFLLGTALAGAEPGDGSGPQEARRHLEAALPQLRQMGETELTGEALLLLGGLALDEARVGGLDPLQRCEQHYRDAAEVFFRLDAPESLASALHNLGLCLEAWADREGDSRERRRARLSAALACFHDALEVEIQNALPQLAEATERERVLAQEMFDRS